MVSLVTVSSKEVSRTPNTNWLNMVGESIINYNYLPRCIKPGLSIYQYAKEGSYTIFRLHGKAKLSEEHPIGSRLPEKQLPRIIRITNWITRITA